MGTPMNLHQEIIARRKEIGLSQIGMARYLYIHDNTYRNLEKGRREMTLREFILICKALRWKPEDKIKEVGERL